jgi:hypothetical protein
MLAQALFVDMADVHVSTSWSGATVTESQRGGFNAESASVPRVWPAAAAGLVALQLQPHQMRGVS